MSSELTHFLDLEEKLRTLNSEIQGLEAGKINKDVYELAQKGYYDFWKFRDLMHTVDEARVELYDVDEQSDFAEFKDAIWTLIDWSEDLLKWREIACRREDGFAKCEEIPARTFVDYQERMEAAGLKCGFISPDEDKISILKAVDSFTNCLHTFALEASKTVEESSELREETDGICEVLKYPEDPESREVLFEACKTFAFNVENNADFYIYSDRGKQHGYIIDDKIQFDVGGYEGHRSEIDLRTMEFVYYEHDLNRGKAVEFALREGLGLECESAEDRIWCKLNSKEDAVKIAKLLAFLPSLDVRFDEVVSEVKHDKWEACMEDCCSEPSEEIEQMCENMCEEECASESDKEACYEECKYFCVRDKCSRYCDFELAGLRGRMQECLNYTLLDVVRGSITWYGDVLDTLRWCGE